MAKYLFEARYTPEGAKGVAREGGSGDLPNTAGARVLWSTGRANARRTGALPLSLPTVSIDDRAVTEGSAVNASFRVALSRAAGQTVTVQYATADGTAAAGADYTATGGPLTFTPGRPTHSIAAPIVTDATPEGTETLTVNLSGATNATLLRAQATGTIGDPPSPATVPMYPAYNFSSDYHFFTTSLAEKNNAVANGYRDESTPVPFNVPNTAVAGASAIFRLYNPNSGRHYYRE